MCKGGISGFFTLVFICFSFAALKIFLAILSVALFGHGMLFD